MWETRLKTPVSVLGTGRMGTALARAFIGSGHATTVWNRTAEKAAPLRALGATLAETVKQAVEASDIIVVNVSDYAASASLLRAEEVAGSLAGKLIIELTSGTPRGAREAARWAESQGARYLDGAILASPDLIGTKSCTVLLSGPPAAFKGVENALRALGGNVRHVGEDPGIASTLDSAALSQMWGGLFGALQAVALCQAERVDLDTLASQWVAVAPVVDGLVADMIARARGKRTVADESTLSTVEVHYGALHHLSDLVRLHSLDPALVEAYEGAFKRAVAAGHLHDDFSAMTLFMRWPEQMARA